MGVNGGYKKTEVGIIPEDWSAKALKEFNFDISDGNYSSKYPKASDFRPLGVPFIRANNIRHMTVTDDDMRFISPLQHQDLQKGHLKENDVLITTRGEIGHLALVPHHHIDSNINAQLVRINVSGTGVDHKYLIYAFSSNSAQEQIKNLQTGSALKQLPVGRLNQLILIFPPPSEQRVIATALSDFDALLNSLDRLIAKKRDLKQAAMQQLLTGQTRLPGFSGVWQVKRLVDVSWFQEGPGVRNSQFTTSGVKLLNGTNIFRGVLNLETTTRFISEFEAYGAYAHFLANEGDIVLASSGFTVEKLHEKVAFVKKDDLPFCMNTSTIRFKANTQFLESGFLFHFLTSNQFKEIIGRMATGSAQLNFGPFHLAKVNISTPPMDEQLAISSILSDLDNEIVGLENQRYKTAALKQGMMQELLTGRIRLMSLQEAI